MEFMQNPAMMPDMAVCPCCGGDDRIGIHSRTDRRYRCHDCGRTFSETKGTPLYNLKYPLWLVMVVLTLLAHGCPVKAIVAAFKTDERTFMDWLRKAGRHGKAIQEKLVCDGDVELEQVQADELCITTQIGKVWMATAMLVRSRLFLWGEVSEDRDKSLISKLIKKVWQAGRNRARQGVLFAVDGFSAYVGAIRKTFFTKKRTGKRGRPRHIPWPDLHVAQVVKRRTDGRVVKVARKVVDGCSARVRQIVAKTQGRGNINTAFIERLNGAFRSRMPSLARRTRHLAKTDRRLESEMFWSGVVYNFHRVHETLKTTPAVKAGKADRPWSTFEILLLRPGAKKLHGSM
jgi:transposase-like protein